MDEVEDGTYLTPKEVGRVLHVSAKTVSRWGARGLIPCLVTLGGHRRFRRDDVDTIGRLMAGAHAAVAAAQPVAG
jgi:excisionase family DNA binding protein